MAIIDILVVVDCLGAVAANDLCNNVYLADSLKFLGSWNEGQCDLHTLTQTGQLVKWRVVPVSPDSTVSITGFSGQLVEQHICRPVNTGLENEVWEGRIQADPGRYTYQLSLSVDGKNMSFIPYIEVQ
ncbi:hypothetical protein DBR32_02935 [Taibaiella sp. KBW10]|uniref:alpha-pore-forming tripartite toxin MakABE regulator n=1 Tax=Taibaiella sp. KBW10 TaxID=2153357 RepID=UPI000F5998E1|nr:hypothetical protein [Taibaiella sp. KBW10]RQO32567.1 hypothetical protein DBR32_02935 [Taibaiella sp. KBW10]